MLTFLLLAGGLAGLVVGAELLVRGAAGLALRFGLSRLIVGLTVVAFGTSSPELGVTMISALGGSTDIGVGNVVGSNIFNVLVILGLTALVAPLRVARQLVVLDVPIMIVISIGTFLLMLNGRVGRLEGWLLFATMIVYVTFLIRLGRRSMAGAEAPGTPTRMDPLLLQIALSAGGLLLLLAGSRWFVSGAVVLARAIGLSDLVIGLTIVAAGTSLPELASSAVAAWRGERDIAVGNAIGSNVFNLLLVLGLTAAVTPGGMAVPASALRLDLPVMLAASLACLPIFATGHRIERWEGGMFLGFYVAYTVLLVLEAQNHAEADTVRNVMFFLVAPLTAVTLAIIAWRARRSARQ